MGLRRDEYGDAHAVAVDTGIRHVATNPLIFMGPQTILQIAGEGRCDAGPATEENAVELDARLPTIRTAMKVSLYSAEQKRLKRSGARTCFIQGL